MKSPLPVNIYLNAFDIAIAGSRRMRHANDLVLLSGSAQKPGACPQCR
jgi:hypothetical protein